MKKALATLVAFVTLAALVVPSLAYADDGHRAPGKSESHKYAVVVGISDYPGDASVLEGGLDLFYADDDARAVKSMLMRKGFDSADITMLTNGRATQRAILHQIQEIAEDARPGDEVVFYFSGHAIIPEVNSEPSADPALAGLWPGDAPASSDAGILVWSDDHSATSVIFDSDLVAAFGEFSGARTLIAFDVCWAGRFGELLGADRFVAMASGSGADAIAGEYGRAYSILGIGPLPEIGWIDQGIFTYFFVVQGLTWNIADFDGDGAVSVQEAFSWAQGAVGAFSDGSGGLLNEYPEYADGTAGDFRL